MAEPRRPIPRPVLLGGLGVGQMLGWGSTFYLPSVLAPAMGASLGLGQDVVFGGVTVMYLVGAVASPRVGRVIDARGVRPVMAAGSVVAAASLVLLAAAQGPASYVAAWIGIGLVLAMTLGQAAFAAIAQGVPGAAARPAMTMLTLVTGFTSSLTWPAMAALEAWLGWRGAVLAFAAMHLAICLPLYLAVLPRGAPGARAETRDGLAPAAPAAPVASAPLSRFRLLLLMLALGLPHAISAGIQLVMIVLITALGHAPATAITLAALIGPAQVAVRIIDLWLGKRSSAMTAGLISAAGLPLCFLPLAAGQSVVFAGLFTLLFGAATGVATVVRAALPLEFAGAAGYGTLTGRLALTGNVMVAAAPPLFAAVLARQGPGMTAALAACLALIALAALAMLALGVRRG